jgi:CubicO group peptidase (beta-lactamase class C family)
MFTFWDHLSLPGMTVTVVKDEEVIYQKGFGVTDLESKTPSSPQTVYHIASVSKHFTAYGILLLQDAGLLSLDDDIRHYLPDFPDYGTTISVRHLLHHTSGIRDQWILWRLSGQTLADPITQDAILNLIKQQKGLNFTPGNKISYTNSGYTLLADIVAKVSGQSFDEFMQEKVFQPLDMQSSIVKSDPDQIINNSASAYLFNERGELEHKPLQYGAYGATNVNTSAEDIAKWMLHLLDGQLGELSLTDRLLTTGMLNDSTSTTYGFGLGVTEYRDQVYALHTGLDGGYRAYLGIFPQQTLGIAILCNYVHVDVGDRGRQIAGLFIPTPPPHDSPPSPEPEPATAEHPEPWQPSRDALREYVGTYHCPEVDSRYSVALENGWLFLRHSRNEAVILTPRSPDTFAGDRDWFNAASFVRDDSGRIIGLNASAIGVHQIWFDKLPTSE